MFNLSFCTLALSSANVETGLFLPTGLSQSPLPDPCFPRLSCIKRWSCDLDMWYEQGASGKYLPSWPWERKAWEKASEESILFSLHFCFWTQLLKDMMMGAERAIFGPHVDTVNDNSQHAKDDKRWKELRYLLPLPSY